MAGKVIQEQLGQELIDSLARFAKRDIKSAAELEANDFAHVTDTNLRKALAETLYGTRWLYKIGLAVLADNEEQFAHVRSQLIDYASICESLLADMIVYAHKKGKLSGTQHKFRDKRLTRPLTWDKTDPLNKTVHFQNFEWRIIVAQESSIIPAKLATKLHGIRTQRNTVHLTLKVMMGVTYYSGIAKRANSAMLDLIKKTRQWKARNP